MEQKMEMEETSVLENCNRTSDEESRNPERSLTEEEYNENTSICQKVTGIEMKQHVTETLISNLEENPVTNYSITTLSTVALEEYIMNLDKEGLEELEELLTKAEEGYYNGESSQLTDEEYDRIVLAYEKVTGTERKKRVSVPDDAQPFPIFMSSLKKAYLESELKKFEKEYSKDSGYVLSDKVNGHAAVYFFSGGTPQLLNGRDGKRGRCIPHLLPSLHLPLIEEGVVVRGELVIPHSEYDSSFGFKEARSMLSSIMATKAPKEEWVKKVCFIAYNVYFNGKMEKTPEEQMKWLEIKGFIVPSWRLVTSLEFSEMTSILEERKKGAPYSIDGIVITHNSLYPLPEEKDPAYCIAFKKREEGVITEVLSVTWKGGKTGVLAPTVHVKPVKVPNGEGGVIEVKKLSGKSLGFIMEGLGPGAVVKVTRSGDSIPEILEIVSKVTPQLPTDDGTWYKNKEENPTALILKEENTDVKAGAISFFLKTMGIKGLGNKGVMKLLSPEFGVDSILDLVALPLSSYELAFGKKKAEAIFKSMQSVIGGVLAKNPYHSAELMASSRVFPGVGVTNASLFIKGHPNYYLKTPVGGVHGLGEKFNMILSKLDEYKEFIKNFTEAWKRAATPDKLEESLLTMGSPVISEERLKQLREKTYFLPSSSSMSRSLKNKLSDLLGREHVRSALPEIIPRENNYVLVVPDMKKGSKYLTIATEKGIPTITVYEMDKLLV